MDSNLTKAQQINDYYANFKFHGISFTAEWKNEDNIDRVYEVIFNNTEPLENQDGEYYNFVGVYYLSKNDINNAFKYLHLAIELHDYESITILGLCYEELKDYDNMLKYYNLAIKHGKYDVYILIGNHYLTIGDEGNFVHYYQLASKHEYSLADTVLAEYRRVVNTSNN